MQYRPKKLKKHVNIANFTAFGHYHESHANSQKNHTKQRLVIEDISNQVIEDTIDKVLNEIDDKGKKD